MQNDEKPAPRVVRAKVIRDHVLPLIRARGAIARLEEGSMLVWDAAPFKFGLITPFSKFPTEPKIRNYQEAALFQQTAKPLPYSLNIWRGTKVLFAEWVDDGEFRLISMKPGAWESEALALS